MKKNIAFDIDGTLIGFLKDEPQYDTINLLKWFAERPEKYNVIVWSGGGRDYALRVVERLGLSSFVNQVMAKPVGSERKRLLGSIDICFDDEAVEFAKINLIV